MSKRTKRYFISDIHLGLGKSTDWYQKSEHEGHLVAALEHVTAEPAAKDLVLLGDIFDTWMSDLGTAPPTTKQIIEADHDPVWKALGKACNAVENVFYLNGNHDMHTGEEDLELLQKRTGASKPIHRVAAYQAGLLYAEHGSRFAMFNATDRMHDPHEGLPLGYYVTRMLAGSRSYTSPKALLGYVDDLLEAAVTTRTLSQSLIEALMEEQELKPDNVFVVSPPRRSLTIGEVQQRYSALFDRWVEKFGYYYAIQAIRGEMNSLGWFADRLCGKRGYKLVVFGHTHEAMEDRDGFFRANRAYVNSGYFCGKVPTFVEVDKLPGRFDVKILESRDGGIASAQGFELVLE